MKAPTPLRLALQNAGVMTLFALVFTTLMAGTHLLTREPIARSAEAERLRLINEILPPASYDNRLLDDVLELGPSPELGLDQGGRVWRARKAGQPVALLIEAVARDGYSGRIRLLIAVQADGRLGGVRVTEHRETPGLGDYIDPKKDKRRDAPWIDQFVGRSLGEPVAEGWKLTRDGGEFDYMSGATISARAVVGAVGAAVRFAARHGDTLYRNTPVTGAPQAQTR